MPELENPAFDAGAFLASAGVGLGIVKPTREADLLFAGRSRRVHLLSSEWPRQADCRCQKWQKTTITLLTTWRVFMDGIVTETMEKVENRNLFPLFHNPYYYCRCFGLEIKL